MNDLQAKLLASTFLTAGAAIQIANQLPENNIDLATIEGAIYAALDPMSTAIATGDHVNRQKYLNHLITLSLAHHARQSDEMASAKSLYDHAIYLLLPTTTIAPATASQGKKKET